MKATVDADRCRGHGVCVALCPAVFRLTDNGYAETGDPSVPTRYQEAVTDAASACPEHAIVTQ